MVVYFAVLYKTIECVSMCLKGVYDICIHMVRKVVNPALGFVLKLISPDLGSISVCCPCEKSELKSTNQSTIFENYPINHPS